MTLTEPLRISALGRKPFLAVSLRGFHRFGVYNDPANIFFIDKLVSNYLPTSFFLETIATVAYTTNDSGECEHTSTLERRESLMNMANEQFESVWDALAGNSAEAEDLKLRSKLMMQIAEQIKFQGWGAEEAAKRFNAPQRKIQSLLDGHLAKFNLSALGASAVVLDTHIHLVS